MWRTHMTLMRFHDLNYLVACLCVRRETNLWTGFPCFLLTGILKTSGSTTMIFSLPKLFWKDRNIVLLVRYDRDYISCFNPIYFTHKNYLAHNLHGSTLFCHLVSTMSPKGSLSEFPNAGSCMTLLLLSEVYSLVKTC